MTPSDLRALIKTTLEPLGLWSENAEELLMATCAQESHLGQYRHQVNGPALGIFQMEPATHVDLWANFLRYKYDLSVKINDLRGKDDFVSALITNDPYAIAMCRVHYLRAKGALPAATDLEGLWAYYKAHYNTPLGAATRDQFVCNYGKYVNGPAR